MRVPVSWLREYVDVDVPLPELADRLSVASAEIEGIERRGVADEGGNLGLFKVGKVLEVSKHPNADRVRLTQVDLGEGEPRSIVCGAWNFEAGATVAVALPDAVLPNGLKLERRKVRGEISDGMILSEDEVGLGDDHAGIMVLEDSLEPGTPLADALPLVEDVLLVESTGNRPDLLSIYGMAREVAALYDSPLRPWPGSGTGPVPTGQVEIDVQDFEGCPRYIGRRFTGVRIGPSPVWLRARLTAAGMRPISNVVDATNYAMLALGNPLHAFDFATLRESRIVVRRARPGEALRTLDGNDRKLEPTDLVIADAERATALGGIMGGEDTEIGPDTTDVLLEAANFEPVGIFRSSERLHLRTEGSNRWEKGVDPHLAHHAADLCTQLIVELAGGTWVADTDAHAELPPRPSVPFRPERADEVIGLATDAGEQFALLDRLGFTSLPGGGVAAPTWRARDVTREIDVVEEIARFRMDEVPFTLPQRRAMFGELTRAQRLRRRVEDVLAGLGFAETYTPSLRADDDTPWKLPEPITVELTALRTRLLPSLVDAARRNADAGADRIALFEVARAYLPGQGDLPDERTRVAAIAEGGFERAKGAVEALYAAVHAEPSFERAEAELYHPGKTARTGAGLVGELHPGVLPGVWAAFELDLGEMLAASRDPITYEDVITYPAVLQDLAFAVDEAVTAGEMATAAMEAAGPELRTMTPFDVYRGSQVGEGKKSVAFRVSFQSPERTLTEKDADRLRAAVVTTLKERFGAELRA